MLSFVKWKIPFHKCGDRIKLLCILWMTVNFSTLRRHIYIHVYIVCQSEIYTCCSILKQYYFEIHSQLLRPLIDSSTSLSITVPEKRNDNDAKLDRI